MSTTTTRERPFNVSAWEVRAIRDGRKTQTRRLVKNPDYYACLTGDCPHQTQTECDAAMLKLCPFGQPRDLLWLRESFTPCEGPGRHCKISDATYVCYRDGDQKHVSTGEITRWRLPDPPDWSKQKSNPFSPSILMPRWASRETLRITGVRIERLQEISGPDCWAEGIESAGWDCTKWGSVTHCYRDLWNSTNGPDSWDANPFVWVIEHERVKE